MKKKLVTICVVMTIVIAASGVANADLWETFVIRNSNIGNISPVISDTSSGKLFEIELAGQKAGWGTNLMNGMKVGDLLSVSITRGPDVTGYGPYMNFWITDGSGNFAVLANEPSNTGEWGSGTPYDTTWDILKDATAKIYETGSSWTPTGSTFSDFAGYTVATPTSHWGGTGAPDDLLASSYTAYGFNWVFGDTQANYLDSHAMSDPELTVVPVPAAVILGALGLSVAGLKLRKFT